MEYGGNDAEQGWGKMHSMAALWENLAGDNGGVEPLQGGKMRACSLVWGAICWRKFWHDCEWELYRCDVLRSYVIALHSAWAHYSCSPEECYCVQADQRLTALGNTCSRDTAPAQRCAIPQLWRETQTLDQLRFWPLLPWKVLFNGFPRSDNADSITQRQKERDSHMETWIAWTRQFLLIVFFSHCRA